MQLLHRSMKVLTALDRPFPVLIGE